MGDDDLQTAAAMYTIAAIAIPVIVAGMVGACSVTAHCTFQSMVPDDRRRLNATVDLAPISGVPVRQVNHGWEGAPAQRPQIHDHVHPVYSVASLRDPPPAYPAHHLDAQFGGVVPGYGNISNTRGAVEMVPVPFPPSYDNANADASDRSL